MGRGTRDKPNKPGKNLAQVRSHLGLSQDGLVRALALSAKLTRNDISKYERGVRDSCFSEFDLTIMACKKRRSLLMPIIE